MSLANRGSEGMNPRLVLAGDDLDLAAFLSGSSVPPDGGMNHWVQKLANAIDFRLIFA